MVAFAVESWLWFGFTISMVICRVVARYLHFGSIRQFQVEDWLMLFIACLYTILIAFLNVCYTASTNLIDPADIPSLTPADIANRVYGSKCVLLVEQCMCAVQWGTKACLLLLYWRLTANLTQNRVVKGTAIFVAGTYIIMEILYFAVWCRPFHDYWQTPTSNIQCTTALHHLIVNLAFNLSSDVLIMSIPLPLLIKAHLPLKKKLLLIFPFTLGCFTIICAILSKHLSFTQPFSAEWVYWYTREASTAMLVTNMPYSWAIIRRVFKIRSFLGDGSTSKSNAGQPGEQGTTTTANFKGPGTTIMQGNRTMSLAFLTRYDSSLQKLPSRSGQNSTDGIVWQDIELKDKPKDPNASDSSTGTGPPLSKIQSQAANALDKLYPLDDEDLEANIWKTTTVRDYEPTV